MKVLHLLLLLGGSAALAVALAPATPPAGQTDARTVDARPQAAALVSGQDQWLAGETRLTRQPDGHFYAEALIDGQAAHMLVDTGASVIALTGADAEAIGLAWEPDDVRPVARGASGPVLGVPVTLQHVSLGGLEARDVQAVIVPDGMAISLLGQSFLSRIGRVEISGDAMVLGG